VFLEPGMGGLETYVRALVPELVRLAPNTRFVVFCSPHGREYLRQQSWSEEVELMTHPLLGRRGTKAVSELSVLGALASRRVDLLHSVALTAPLRTRAVNVVFVADVTWIVAPDADAPGTMRLWRLIVPRVARRADRLLTCSQAAADDIVRHLRVPRGKIDVVALASGAGDPRSSPTTPQQLRDKLGLGSGPVVLTVSAKKTHKNLVRLMHAMAAVVARQPEAMLVLPGRPTEHERELRELAQELGIAGHVAFPAYVGAADLDGLYALAQCFVFPSLNEGFGIPVLEAMRHGVPVACSRTSSLPEVGGEAVRYFDPCSVQEIASAVLDLLEDQELAARLVALGREQESRFTWEATARGTLESYARAWALRPAEA
jgi:glycosyltransferase involved in cell wall biosynthesis